MERTTVLFRASILLIILSYTSAAPALHNGSQNETSFNLANSDSTGFNVNVSDSDQKSTETSYGSSELGKVEISKHNLSNETSNYIQTDNKTSENDSQKTMIKSALLSSLPILKSLNSDNNFDINFKSPQINLDKKVHIINHMNRGNPVIHDDNDGSTKDYTVQLLSNTFDSILSKPFTPSYSKDNSVIHKRIYPNHSKIDSDITSTTLKPSQKQSEQEKNIQESDKSETKSDVLKKTDQLHRKSKYLDNGYVTETESKSASPTPGHDSAAISQGREESKNKNDSQQFSAMNNIITYNNNNNSTTVQPNKTSNYDNFNANQKNILNKDKTNEYISKEKNINDAQNSRESLGIINTPNDEDSGKISYVVENKKDNGQYTDTEYNIENLPSEFFKKVPKKIKIVPDKNIQIALQRELTAFTKLFEDIFNQDDKKSSADNTKEISSFNKNSNITTELSKNDSIKSSSPRKYDKEVVFSNQMRLLMPLNNSETKTIDGEVLKKSTELNQIEEKNNGILSEPNTNFNNYSFNQPKTDLSPPTRGDVKYDDSKTTNKEEIYANQNINFGERYQGKKNIEPSTYIPNQDPIVDLKSKISSDIAISNLKYQDRLNSKKEKDENVQWIKVETIPANSARNSKNHVVTTSTHIASQRNYVGTDTPTTESQLYRISSEISTLPDQITSNPQKNQNEENNKQSITEGKTGYILQSNNRGQLRHSNINVQNKGNSLNQQHIQNIVSKQSQTTQNKSRNDALESKIDYVNVHGADMKTNVYPEMSTITSQINHKDNEAEKQVSSGLNTEESSYYGNINNLKSTINKNVDIKINTEKNIDGFLSQDDPKKIRDNIDSIKNPNDSNVRKSGETFQGRRYLPETAKTESLHINLNSQISGSNDDSEGLRRGSKKYVPTRFETISPFITDSDTNKLYIDSNPTKTSHSFVTAIPRNTVNYLNDKTVLNENNRNLDVNNDNEVLNNPQSSRPYRGSIKYKWEPANYDWTGDNSNNNYPSQFSYKYKGANDTSVYQKGYLKNINDKKVFVVKGSYKYTAPDGTPVLVKYTADEFGFHPQEFKNDESSQSSEESRKLSSEESDESLDPSNSIDSSSPKAQFTTTATTTKPTVSQTTATTPKIFTTLKPTAVTVDILENFTGYDDDDDDDDGDVTENPLIRMFS